MLVDDAALYDGAGADAWLIRTASPDGRLALFLGPTCSVIWHLLAVANDAKTVKGFVTSGKRYGQNDGNRQRNCTTRWMKA